MLPLNTLRWGHAGPQPARRALRAGPLRLYFEGGDLRYIRLGDREVLRRVYVAVRDRDWGTIPLALSDLQIEQGRDRFAISFQANHRQREIDFRWRGTITGDERGTITFAMDGAAGSTFLRNRIGFCVLHPPETCAGRSCVIEQDHGGRATDEFPYHISPHQPFVELRAIAHQVQPDVWFETRFAGDIFEMEDQRNWTDASYKTYCTPLRLPFPIKIAAGTPVRQAVTLTLTGTAQPTVTGALPGPTTLTVGTEARGKLPRLGLGVASHGRALDETALARLRALNLAHLRVDLFLDSEDWRGRFAQATAEARALGTELEVALTLSDGAEDELYELATALPDLDPPVARWLVFHRDEPVTTVPWTSLARRILEPLAPGAAFGGGTDAYFTQLNRNRPALDALDLVSYSINPQVHAFDDASLVETLTMQGATVESARLFTDDLPIAISPVTLLPRANPDATAPPEAHATIRPLPPADPRQPSLFAAAWTVGSVASLATAGVASATYYETTGANGVMGDQTGPLAGLAYPVHHVFAALGALRGGAVLPVSSSDPLRAAALAIRYGDRTHVFLANLLPAPQPLTVQLPGTSATIRRLDETTAEAAMRDPESFAAAQGETRAIEEGALVLDMLPYGVALIVAE